MNSAYWGNANSQEHVFMIFNPVKALVWAPAQPPKFLKKNLTRQKNKNKTKKWGGGTRAQTRVFTGLKIITTCSLVSYLSFAYPQYAEFIRVNFDGTPAQISFSRKRPNIETKKVFYTISIFPSYLNKN